MWTRIGPGAASADRRACRHLPSRLPLPEVCLLGGAWFAVSCQYLGVPAQPPRPFNEMQLTWMVTDDWWTWNRMDVRILDLWDRLVFSRASLQTNVESWFVLQQAQPLLHIRDPSQVCYFKCLALIEPFCGNPLPSCAQWVANQTQYVIRHPCFENKGTAVRSVC